MENYENNNVTFSALSFLVTEIVRSIKQNVCFSKKFIHPHTSRLQNQEVSKCSYCQQCVNIAQLNSCWVDNFHNSKVDWNGCSVKLFSHKWSELREASKLSARSGLESWNDVIWFSECFILFASSVLILHIFDGKHYNNLCVFWMFSMQYAGILIVHVFLFKWLKMKEFKFHIRWEMLILILFDKFLNGLQFSYIITCEQVSTVQSQFPWCNSISSFYKSFLFQSTSFDTSWEAKCIHYHQPWVHQFCHL